MNWQAVSFDWNQIRAFLATVEAGSLSAAARALRLTQPTLSRQVAALEDDLGVMLFERVGRSLSLTGAGRELLEHVRAMGDAASRISLVASGQSQAVEGLVRITASESVAAYILPDILRQLYEVAPGIQVEVIASNDIDDLMRREADIALRHVKPEQDDLIAKSCAATTAQLYAATSYFDRYGRPGTMEDLADRAFIGFADDGGYLAELNARGVPVTHRNFKWTTKNFLVAWEMTRQGLGICMMIESIAKTVPGVEPVVPGIEPIPVPLWLVTHRELHTSRRIRLVYDFLAEALG
ncbi:LysR family transcriptional regulator [Pelagibacterium halotolerans]|uniref:LysR family transcriptional regulator n=1 Tax=Pelagibacterium halotolerans TaxID=531813 RepID=UPI00384E6B4A